MRIVHVITRLIIGGAQENTILTCEGLREQGHEVFLVSGPTTGPEGSLEPRARDGGYDFEIVPSLIRQVCPFQDVRALFALNRLFKRLRPDVVHTHSSKAGVLGRIAATRVGVPAIVHTIHGMSFNRTQPRWIRSGYACAERYCAKKCHAIVSVADAMTEQALEAGIGRPDKFHTIRSGMDVADFDPDKYDRAAVRSEWGFGDDEIVVGTVARLFYNKGYEQLIEVMQQSLVREPRLRFVWVGDGAARPAYEAELERRGLRRNTLLTGLLPPEQMPRVLAGIDLLAHTSLWEGLPRAVVQALLMRKPAVCFAIDGAPEVVIPGKTGRTAPLYDIATFADALVELARDPRRRAEHGDAGRKLCLDQFDHRRMVDDLIRLYSRITV